MRRRQILRQKLSKIEVLLTFCQSKTGFVTVQDCNQLGLRQLLAQFSSENSHKMGFPSRVMMMQGAGTI